MPALRPAIRTLLALAACCALAGCKSTVTPHLDLGSHHLFNWRTKTVEYPGPPRYWNTAGLVISPARSVALVGTEVPMFAGICDGKGQLQPYEQVEWMLEPSGVGSFMSVSEPIRPFCLELVSSKPRKVDNNYALTETLPANVVLTRGTADLNDDMVMPRGYTWVTLTSPAEGVSYVTAYGPDVYSWDARQKSAKIHWIDAEWCFPEPGCAPPTGPVTLTTCVVKRTTKAPLADWVVKYCVSGGTEAGLGPDNCQSVEVATDEQGRASVLVNPPEGATGTTCINIELIRSECANPCDPERLSIACAATHINWSTPGSPAPTCEGGAPASPALPTPISPPVAAPPTLPAQPQAPPAQPQAPPTQPQPSPPPQAMAAPRLDLKITGPETAQLGADVEFKLEVTNRGDAPATGLQILDRFDAGLQHARFTSPIQREFGDLAPGETKEVRVVLRVTRPGRLCNTMEVSGPSGLRETQQACVTVEAPAQPVPPAMTVTLSAPPSSRVGEVARFTVELVNTGDVPARDVRMVITLDPQLKAEQASQGVQRTGDGSLTWAIENLAPGARETREVVATCVAPTQQAFVRVSVTDASRVNLGDQKSLEIAPAPQSAQPRSNLQVQINSRTNPARAGTDVSYRITITNAGLNAERQVRLSLTIPEQMQFVNAPQAPARVSVIDPPQVRFDPVLELRPGEQIAFDVVLRASRAGTAQVTAEVSNPNTPQPLTAAATTNIFAE